MSGSFIYNLAMDCLDFLKDNPDKLVYFWVKKDPENIEEFLNRFDINYQDDEKEVRFSISISDIERNSNIPLSLLTTYPVIKFDY